MVHKKEVMESYGHPIPERRRHKGGQDEGKKYNFVLEDIQLVTGNQFVDMCVNFWHEDLPLFTFLYLDYCLQLVVVIITLRPLCSRYRVYR